MAIPRQTDPDIHMGAVEGDRAGDRQHSNRNATSLNRYGLPASVRAIAEDRIGANVDDSEVAHASETGRTADGPRDEEDPLN